MHHRRSSSDGKVRLDAQTSAFGRLKASLYEQMKSGEQTLVAIQRYETPALTVAAKTFSFFGAETFYILLIATSLWNWDFRFGFMFAQLLAMSLTVGNVFKNVFLLPRPQSPPVHVHDVEHDWGLPSTHALASVALGGYTWLYTYEHRQQWQVSDNFLVGLAVGVLIWALCVMVSRLYLGLHSPIDIYTGILLGLIMLAAFASFDDALDAWLLSSPYSMYKAVFGCMLVIAFHPKPYPTTSFFTSVIILGTASGFYIAYADVTHGVFSKHAMSYPPLTALNVVRTLLGFVVLVVVKEVQKLLYYPAFDLVCKTLGVSYTKHIATKIERQPSFTHLGVLDRLMGYHRRQKMSKLIPLRNSGDSIPVDPLIRQHETNLELIINHRRYLINIDVVVKFLIYLSLPMTALYLMKLYSVLGV